jgi:hypothetical protein
MLPEYFQSASRVRDLRVGPAGPLVTSFAATIRETGIRSGPELKSRRSAVKW